VTSVYTAVWLRPQKTTLVTMTEFYLTQFQLVAYNACKTELEDLHLSASVSTT